MSYPDELHVDSEITPDDCLRMALKVAAKQEALHTLYRLTEDVDIEDIEGVCEAHDYTKIGDIPADFGPEELELLHDTLEDENDELNDQRDNLKTQIEEEIARLQKIADAIEA